MRFQSIAFASFLFIFASCTSTTKKIKPRPVPLPAVSAGTTAPPPLSNVPYLLNVPLFSLKNPDSTYSRYHHAKVLEMAETFTMTHETPIVKLGALKYFHLNLEFDVLALQTSAIDTWLAMDTLLNDKNEAKALSLARDLLFPLAWQTNEMEEVVRYAQQNKEEQTLYLAGFQNELGDGYGFNNHFLVPLLGNAFRTYGLRVTLDEIKTKLEPLMGLRNCNQSGFPASAAEEARFRSALAVLSAWVKQLAPAITRRFPLTPHGTMLELFPTSLQNNFYLCQALKSERSLKNSTIFLQKREAQSAEMILQISNSVSRNGHTLVWTSARTGNYNTLKKLPPTHSQILKQKLEGDYSLIGFFPLAGEAILNEGNPEIFNFPPPVSVLQSFFGQSVQEPSFLEVRKSNYFQTQSSVWIEGVLTPAIPGRDYDALIVLPRTTRPHWYYAHLLKK
ncbi:MAG: hypothetical protein H7333_10380 [Bdellovibrionales bacterium]|nr:hypothetical protein [Oligoflexia bacterium]